TNCPAVSVPIEHGHALHAPAVVGAPKPEGEARDSTTPAAVSGRRFTATKVAEMVAGGVTAEGAAAPTARSAPGRAGPKRKTSDCPLWSRETRLDAGLSKAVH